MWRACSLVLFGTTLAISQGIQDPAFENIPFAEWLKGGANSRVDWFVRVYPASLSDSQRLETYIHVNVAAHEFVKRPRRGQMAAFLEIRNRDQHVFRKHWRLLPAKDQTPEAHGYVRFVEHVCIVPGDYDVAVAVYDTESKTHNLKRTRFHVSALPHDLLSETWRALPDVAFGSCGPANSPPRLIRLTTASRVRIEVVVNRSANRDKTTGKERLPNGLIPRLQSIAAVQIPNGSMYVTALDVERRKVILREEVRANVISRRMQAAINRNDPYRIDAPSLQGHGENAQFFISEIRKRLEIPESAEAERILIVLSPPLALPKDVDMRPIEVTPAQRTRAFYIRTQSIVFGSGMPSSPLPSPGSWNDPPPSLPTGPQVQSPPQPNNRDSLERTLRPLKPRLFDVTTAPEFRRALGAIVNEISNSK